MKKSLLFLLLILFSTSAYSATISCEFKPIITKVGETGANESKLFVCETSSKCYYIGESEDHRAEQRYSTAMTALVADKHIRLRFYNIANCDTAVANMSLPTATWLIK